MLCEKNKCVGCLACYEICPVHAIHVAEDEQGFAHPEIDETSCINCKKCEAVCPSMDEMDKRHFMGVYAAQHKSGEIRANSSSGGIFSAFARQIIAWGGVVMGASFENDYVVRHILAENEEELASLRGSKYVQSSMQGCYAVIQKQLDLGKKVLFSGTPCQVAGVRKYFKGADENLITCDLVCHGVPSPEIFQKMLHLYEKNYGSKIIACNFRKKNPNWNMFSLEICFENGKKHLKTRDADPYMKGFLNSIYLRPSCYDCRFADVRRVSDITVADFWGYVDDNEKIQNDNKGISLVIINSEKGQKLLEAVQDEVVFVEKSMEEARQENYCLHQSFPKPDVYDAFWNDYETMDFADVCKKYLSVNGKLYIDQPETEKIFDEITVIPSDAVGSKGDEAMLRGMLNLFEGKKIRMLTPRPELWKGWLIDRNDVYDEEYVKLEDLKDTISQPTHLAIIGADLMDGLYGSADTLMRLDAAERVIDLGGRADVFSCSFRTEVSEEILKKIINIGDRLHFHFRDMQSLHNFKEQTGLDAEYFPDLAFLCEKTLTGQTKKINQEIKQKKEDGYIIVGINFCEHACKGFYENPTWKQRKDYVASVIDTISSVLENRIFYVLIPHDIRHWDGHYSDADYARWAKDYIDLQYASDAAAALDHYLTETELLSILPELDMVISGRMHLDVAAIRSAVVPIGYMGNRQKSYRNIEKFCGMFQMRMGRGGVELVAGSKEEFEAALCAAVRDKDQIRDAIIERNRRLTADMVHQANQFRNTIGLPDLKEDTESVLYRSGNVTETIRYIAETMENMESMKQYHREQLLQQELQIQERDQLIQEQEERCNTQEGYIHQKEAHIELLLQSERDLKNEIVAMQNSRTWRIAFMLHKPIVWMFPEKSRRRLFVKMFCRLLRHPIRSVKMLSPSRIRNFLTFLNEEGPEFVSNRMDESMRGNEIQRKELELSKILPDKPFEEYEKLCFPQAEDPKVSIVIPVYNQFHYTYNCLWSILKNTGDAVSYEIIIANDCSTDDTTRLQELIENIRILTNEENLRFLKNCNRAAGYAKGEYILFLNNDTQVQENWLEPLAALMEKDDSVGMTGSKLVYATGQLQEAGGIVWKDGSARNYGHGMNTENPEFNYVKETDYISGASIMIRASLWKEIGGFDERFAPAYYEDTDLAYEVRQRSYRVLYQPLSTVVHFEGISNGTDISSGQKSYQIKNQKKFYKKWKEVLEKENYKNGENVFLAKDRSGRKKTLLMIDHYVPMYDKDAGSRCMFYYLNLFVHMGYNVKFIGDNFYQHEPYTTTLQQMGVEVLYGNYYHDNWKDWLKSNGRYFDYVFLSRPHISIKYIDIVRELTNAKIIYFGHDLHFLREMREYELTGNKQSLKASKDWKKTELELMQKADISYYLSNAELEEIAKADSSVKVRRVPINIYSEIPDIDYCAEKRQDIIFVGGFGHPPNVDAVKWLGEEIMPRVWSKHPDIVLHVVGSKPPRKIQEFSSERMIIHGFVSDEDLEEMYQNVKLSIAPLRFGAGIKGKIIEAMMRGIPMITTNIGIEGIDGAEHIAKVSDDAGGLAEYITDIYNNAEALEKMAEEEHQYIIDNYSVKNAVEILGQDFEF